MRETILCLTFDYQHENYFYWAQCIFEWAFQSVFNKKAGFALENWLSSLMS